MIASGEDVRTLVDSMGVKLCPHTLSIKMVIYDKLAALFGVPDFKNNFFVGFNDVIYYPAILSSPIRQCPVSILHELVHIDQQRKHGAYLWLARYFLSKKFRWEQEAKAYLMDIKYGADPKEISETLTRSYFISKPTTQEKIEWFEKHDIA